MTAGTSTTEPAAVPVFTGSIATVSAERLSHSWREGCPVSPDALRLVAVTYWGLDRATHLGELVVGVDDAESILAVFGQLFDLGFPIDSVIPIGDLEPGAEDEPGYNNTSGFNCRLIEGTTTWSEHARGLAIDINVRQNPFIDGGYIWPEGSEPYVDRTLGEPGMITDGDRVVAAFGSIGWSWGGDWTTKKDYQHFSSTGR